MVADKLAEILLAVLFISEHHVIPYARCDDHLLYALDRAERLQQLGLLAVALLQHGAYLRRYAALLRAAALLFHPLAARCVHVGRRPAHVVYPALEQGMSHHLLCLGHDGRPAPAPHCPPFVHGYGAKAALSVTAPVRRDGQPYCLGRLYIPVLPGERVKVAFVFEAVDGVKLRLRQMHGRRVLDEIPVVVPLAKGPCRKRVVVVIEGIEREREGVLVRGRLLVRRQLDAALRHFFRYIAEPADCLGVFAVPETIREFHDRTLGHAVEEIVGLRVKEDGLPYAVRPEVIVGHAAQARLDAAEYDRTRIFKVPPDEVRVDDRGPVRTAVVYAARRVVVGLSPAAGCGAVGDHRVYAAACNAPEWLGPAEGADVGPGIHVRLADDADPVPGLQEHLADYSRADKGRVDV